LITIEKYCKKRITRYRNLWKATAFKGNPHPSYILRCDPLRAIKLIDFSVEGKQLDVHVDFESGSKFPCAKARQVERDRTPIGSRWLIAKPGKRPGQRDEWRFWK